MGLVINFKKIEQPTILVIFFEIRGYTSIVFIIIVINCQLAFNLDN